MKTQYMALVKYKEFPDRWMNAASYVKKLDGSDSSRYFETKEDAENAIRVALNKFNKDYKYNQNGERLEVLECGYIGVSITVPNAIDDSLRIIDWKISKRVVSDWEIEERMLLS